uniref:Uncharacterized mitochondrial protein AtMg00810-like n=1 Tax=Nicotiana tabacum TaxID=4097 RepID=A0A1S4DI16_TOBAC|nr:PREDICTED: uncharacterized mitochondrial protein AtMg00810-like [Nicotiana tabacum]
MELLHEPGGIILTQRKFAIDLISEFDSLQSRNICTPLDSHIKLTADFGELLPDPTIYRRLLGKLNFLTNIQPDLSFTIQTLSQDMQSPRSGHYQAALHTLRYVRNDPSLGLFFSSEPSFQILGYCDADWASCSDTQRSVSGFFLSIGGCPVSWKSKKQQVISLSSAEAEYRSIRRLVAELSWIVHLLADISISPSFPVYVHCDNQAAIHIAKNLVFYERTKHIEIDCHLVREKLLDGLISLSFVLTIAQIADIFTKVLTGPLHRSFLGKLGVRSTGSHLKGVLTELSQKVPQILSKQKQYQDIVHVVV